MIKALRAAAAKVPFQKDKMASPSPLCVTSSVCTGGDVVGVTPWTELFHNTLWLLSGYNKLPSYGIKAGKRPIGVAWSVVSPHEETETTSVFVLCCQEETTVHEQDGVFQWYIHTQTHTQWAVNNQFCLYQPFNPYTVPHSSLYYKAICGTNSYYTPMIVVYWLLTSYIHKIVFCEVRCESKWFTAI